MSPALSGGVCGVSPSRFDRRYRPRLNDVDGYDLPVSTPDPAGEKLPRLTKEAREVLLETNEGFTDSTYYSAKNITESRKYEIKGGQLHVHSHSKGSWGGSRQETDFIADDQATHRFLNKHLPDLRTDGVTEKAAILRAERKAAQKVERAAAASQVAEASVPAAPSATPRAKRLPGSVDTADLVRFTVGAIVTVVWIAPHAKAAWETKAKPRVEAWRARRAAKSQPGTDPGVQEAPVDGQDLPEQ